MSTQCTFKIYLQPGAKKSEFVGKHGDYIKIKVQSPPVEGKANAALITFLAKACDISKSSISIASGEKSRFKTICIKRCDEHLKEKILKIMLGEIK
jgi:hypothetical protein